MLPFRELGQLAGIRSAATEAIIPQAERLGVTDRPGR